MITQKDLQDVVDAFNEVLKGMDDRLKKLEEAEKPSSAQRGRPKKVEEK